MKTRRRKKKPGSHKPPADESRLESARDSVASFLSHKSKRTPVGGAAKTPALKPVEVAVLDAENRSKAGTWTGATGRTFVGLYALCHRIVYGEIPLELFEKMEFSIAARMATKALHEWFVDDPTFLVEFVKWSWTREESRDAWAIREGKDRTRMRARFQFSAAMVQDWRIDRTKGRRRRRGR